MGKLSANIFYRSAISFTIMLFGIMVVALLMTTTTPLSYPTLQLLQTIIQEIHLIIIQLLHGDFERLFAHDETTTRHPWEAQDNICKVLIDQILQKIHLVLEIRVTISKYAAFFLKWTWNSFNLIKKKKLMDKKICIFLHTHLTLWTAR